MDTSGLAGTQDATVEDILGWMRCASATFFEKQGYILKEWKKVPTDTLSIVQTG